MSASIAVEDIRSAIDATRRAVANALCQVSPVTNAFTRAGRRKAARRDLMAALDMLECAECNLETLVSEIRATVSR